MNTVSVNQFRDNLKSFVVVSTDDGEREQETLYVLQNQSLMRQIAASSTTHAQRKGYTPTDTELHAILGV